jgi:hypothetical protein
MRRPLVIYDFATAPYWIFLHLRKILFSFLSVRFSFFYISSNEKTTKQGGRYWCFMFPKRKNSKV